MAYRVGVSGNFLGVYIWFTVHTVRRRHSCLRLEKSLNILKSMSLCPELPGELKARVTFSEDMYNLFALIAMSASGGTPCDEVGC